MAYTLGGHVDTAPVSEYGKTEITTSESKLFEMLIKYSSLDEPYGLYR